MPGIVLDYEAIALTELMYLEPSNKQINAKYNVRKQVLARTKQGKDRERAAFRNKANPSKSCSNSTPRDSDRNEARELGREDQAMQLFYELRT